MSLKSKIIAYIFILSSCSTDNKVDFFSDPESQRKLGKGGPIEENRLDIDFIEGYGPGEMLTDKEFLYSTKNANQRQ